MKKIVITFISLLFVMVGFGQDAEVLKQDIVYTIDPLGDATIEISSKLTARQWQNWESVYGPRNTSILKRDIERTLSYFYLYDFEYDQDEMERSYKFGFKAKGLARYLGNDEWRADMGLKEPDFSKLTDNSYLVTSSLVEAGLIIQQNNKIFFPEEAFDVEEDTDEFGLAVFDYKLETKSSGAPIFLYLGILCIVLAIAAYFVMGKQKATA